MMQRLGPDHDFGRDGGRTIHRRDTAYPIDYHAPLRASSPSLRPRRYLGFSRFVKVIATTLSIWSERATQRRALRDLDEHQLHDIGITREEADREANKWFWN
jgi:uncharacterized protein YjiS (DUF1127 family)